MSIEFFDLLALFLRRDHLLPKVLIEMGFWFPRKIFVFLGACLSKIETELFSKAAWVLTVDILVQISNLNWSLLNCLILQYINFLWFRLSDFVLRIVYII